MKLGRAGSGPPGEGSGGGGIDRSALIAALVNVLPGRAVVADPDVLQSYRGDEATFLTGGTPGVAVLPESTEQVSAVLRLADEHRVPVVPRGAGSGLAGGANATDGCIVLSTVRMDRIVAVDAVDGYAVVQPGVLNAALKQAAGEHGLFYPPDPASAAFCTIGGNVATNAGGLCCVKYGVTRDYVLGLEVVLADGRAARVGRRTVKGVAGLDLTGLFVGSEGTLGVVTEITVRLVPAPAPPTTVVAMYDDLERAGLGVERILRSGVTASLFEMMDQATLRAVDDWRNVGIEPETQALLLLQVDTGGSRARDETAAIVEACEASGATFVSATDDPDETFALLEARKLAYPALERLGTVLLDDVAVPRSQVTALIRGVGRIAAAHELTVGTFGHVGDGNMHPTIVFSRADTASRRRAQSAFDEIVRLGLALGGTTTGEHGIGLLKRHLLADELGPTVLDLQRRLKLALDPHEILNPGKVF